MYIILALVFALFLFFCVFALAWSSCVLEALVSFSGSHFCLDVIWFSLFLPWSIVRVCVAALVFLPCATCRLSVILDVCAVCEALVHVFASVSCFCTCCCLAVSFLWVFLPRRDLLVSFLLLWAILLRVFTLALCVFVPSPWYKVLLIDSTLVCSSYSCVYFCLGVIFGGLLLSWCGILM